MEYTVKIYTPAEVCTIKLHSVDLPSEATLIEIYTVKLHFVILLNQTHLSYI